MKSAAEKIEAGLEELGFTYSAGQIESFRTYLAELKRWNRAHNLTGLRTDRDIIVKHFLDSLLFLKVLPAAVRSVADVGSGAGFPGLPMKIMNPALTLYLVEPTKKKAVFLRHISHLLGLTDVEVIDRRIGEVSGLAVDAAVTRALFSVQDFVREAGHVLAPGGLLILSKGQEYGHELNGIDPHKIQIARLKLPFEEVYRHLVSAKLQPG